MTPEESKQISINYQRAVRNINDRAWTVMLPGEKLETLQAIENYNAMQNNRLAAEIIPKPMEPESYGYQVDNNIYINEKILESPDYNENIDTLFHEGSHIKDWQAGFLKEVQEQYAPSYLQELQTPVPDSSIDPHGYYYHPAEIKARQAGIEGVQQVADDQAKIIMADQALNNHQNQILQTYDYDALSYADHMSHQNQILQTSPNITFNAVASNEIPANPLPGTQVTWNDMDIFITDDNEKNFVDVTITETDISLFETEQETDKTSADTLTFSPGTSSDFNTGINDGFNNDISVNPGNDTSISSDYSYSASIDDCCSVNTDLDADISDDDNY